MAVKKKAVFNWSGGKDSALALYKILQDTDFEIVSLLTTIDSTTSSSSVHYIPEQLLQAQADSIGLPLYKVLLPGQGLNEYNTEMQRAAEYFKKEGVTHFIFGDIFVFDVKSIREKQFNPLGIEVIEPLWDKTPEEVMDEFLASGIRTKVIVTQADKLGAEFVGRELNREFIASLPKEIDICGEKGEYHTFVYDAPMFKGRIDFVMDSPRKISHDIKLKEGNIETFTYWQIPIRQS